MKTAGVKIKKLSLKGFPLLVHGDWEDDLIGCPDQCYLKLEYRGYRYVLYLRWRHGDPWTADLIQTLPDFDMHIGYIWFELNVEYFKNEQLKEFKIHAMDVAKKRLTK